MKKIFKRSLSILMSALLICSMAFSLQIKTVVAEETPVMEDEAVTVNNSESSATMTLDDAKKMIGVKDENGVDTTSYTGEGIRVGIIEPGNPSNCACGEAEIEPHVFQEIFGEARTCAKCGYSE